MDEAYGLTDQIDKLVGGGWPGWAVDHAPHDPVREET